MGCAGKEGAARCLSWDHRGAHGIHSPVFLPTDDEEKGKGTKKGLFAHGVCANFSSKIRKVICIFDFCS